MKIHVNASSSQDNNGNTVMVLQKVLVFFVASMLFPPQTEEGLS